MQSFIIVSKNKKIREDQSLKICTENKIDVFDINILESNQNTSIGIDEIRNFQKKLYLKPIKSKVKAGIIKNAENLTFTSQNAMLKLLEEPPINTIIILEITNKEVLLPTILSRCQLIEIKDKLIEILDEEINKNFDLIFNLDALPAGEKMKIAQNYSKTKEMALLWIEQMIISVRKKIIREHNELLNKKIVEILKSLQKTYEIISSTNVNPRFSLENLLINS